MTADDTLQALADIVSDLNDHDWLRTSMGSTLDIARELICRGVYVVPAAPATGEDELREQIAAALYVHAARTLSPTTWRSVPGLEADEWRSEASAVMAVVRPLLAQRDQARLGRADEKAIANAALAAASEEQKRADRAEADLAAARQQLEQVQRELTIERINPDDYAGSEDWSEACYEVQAHDECDDPGCRCPCHAIVLGVEPADETGGAT